MKSIPKRVLRLALCALALFVFKIGAEVAPPSILPGAMIAVKDWDSKSQTFQVEVMGYEAQGPNYTTAENLAAAVTTLDLKRLKHDPKKIVGNQYKLDKELIQLPVLETEKRRQAKP